MRAKAIVLDLDGVIFKTTLVKHKAMLSLFEEYPQKLPAISKSILDMGGVPRREKITVLIRQHLEVRFSNALLEKLLGEYANALNYQLADAELVEGIESFVKTSSEPLYISSSAPQSEIESRLANKGLSTYFAKTFCGDMPKHEALQMITSDLNSMKVVFFGDALADLNAARTANVGFVGIVSEQDAFLHESIPKISNFSDQLRVVRSIDKAFVNSNLTEKLE